MIEDTTTGNNPSFSLICWPQKDNKLLIVPVKKIVSSILVDLAPEAFCKVRGLEGHPYKHVSLGTEADRKITYNNLLICYASDTKSRRLLMFDARVQEGCLRPQRNNECCHALQHIAPE